MFSRSHSSGHYDPTKTRSRPGRCEPRIETDTQHGAVVPPIHLTSTFAFGGYGEKREYDYSRSGNPTRDALGRALADLEGGVGATVTSSGMSAVSLVTHLVGPEQLIVVPHDCYGGTYRLFNALHARGLAATCVSWIIRSRTCSPRRSRTSRHSSGSRRRATHCCASSIFARSPRVPRRRERSSSADNTFLSPVWQQPLELGADLVVHSTTKYLNGHSDVVGGAVIASTPELHEQLRWWGNCIGVTGAPFDSFMTLRGLRTLHARMRAHGENAQRIAELLAQHEAVSKVYFPGLPSHPGHAIARAQQQGFGAMVSFDLHGSVENVKVLLNHTRLFSLAESLGGVESLIAHPASMTHAAMDEAARTRAGISATHWCACRSAIEDGADLARDLKDGLDAALSVT